MKRRRAARPRARSARAELGFIASSGLLAAVLLPGCGSSAPDHAGTIAAIHAQILQAHRDRDAEAWTRLEADTVTVASRGDVFRAARPERLAMRQSYFGSTRFSVYRDLQPPIVRVSGDASMAWLYANVEVVAHADAPGATDSSHTIWAWIELYERRDGRWLMTGNVSNEKPGGLAADPAAAPSGEPAPEARPANDMFPRWSPDGRSIVFTSDRDGDPEIYVMAADGTQPRRLTRASGRDAHPAYSPDGRTIVFQSPRANGVDTNIYVMEASGSNVLQLTRLVGFAGVPVYSPDGARIVFQWRQSNDFDDTAKWRICTMAADGSDFRTITAGDANDQVPNWSRDGARLLFFSDRTGKNQIYTMNADGTDVRRVASTESDDVAAFWSPDDRWIAFASDRGGNPDLYVMGSGGTDVRRLTETPATERGAVFAPDGERLLFSADGDGPSRIYTMTIDGTGVRCLTCSAGPSG